MGPRKGALTMCDLTDAACRGMDVELFFPVGTPGAPAYERGVERAKAVCRTCPAVDACLFWALNHGIEFGVFGATDGPERADLLRALPRVPAA